MPWLDRLLYMEIRHRMTHATCIAGDNPKHPISWGYFASVLTVPAINGRASQVVEIGHVRRAAERLQKEGLIQIISAGQQLAITCLIAKGEFSENTRSDRVEDGLKASNDAGLNGSDSARFDRPKGSTEVRQGRSDRGPTGLKASNGAACSDFEEGRSDRPKKQRSDTKTIETVFNPSSKDMSSCPRKQILDLYHAHCPLLPTVRVMTPKRNQQLTARWKQDPKHRSLEFWERYFAYVAKSPFLNGNNNRGWTADFGWLVNPENFAKVIEGKYHKEGGS